MITTLQQKVNFALNEFRREKRLKENARKIFSMNQSLNLDDVEEDKTDSEFFNEFVDRLYSKMNGHNTNKLKDDLSINSSERMNESVNTSNNTSKNSTLDSKKITRNPSQGSLNSIKSKSSTTSRKSNNYDSNLMPVRRQFLVKGLKNFKEPIERSRSAPKLTSIEEEFDCSTEDDEEEPYFNKLINNNFVNYNFYNICEESDDETIIKELGLISDLNEQDEESHELEDKTLTEFSEQDLVKLTPILTGDKFNGNYENENDPDSWNLNSLNSLNRNEIINQLDDFNHSNSVNTDETISSESTISKPINEAKPINTIKDNQDEELTDKKELTANDSESIKLSELSSNDDRLSDRLSDKFDKFDNKSLESSTQLNDFNQLNELNESNLYDAIDSPSFIVCDKMRIYKKANPFNSKECDLHAKQIVNNCKMIKELVLNF